MHRLCKHSLFASTSFSPSPRTLCTSAASPSDTPRVHYRPIDLKPAQERRGGRAALKYPEGTEPLAPHKVERETMHAGFTTGYGPRMYEYEQKAAYVQSQPTVVEKIQASTPFQREWSMMEKNLHRQNQPLLVQPRGAYRVSNSPAYASAAFHDYLARTVRLPWTPPASEEGQTIYALPDVDTVDGEQVGKLTAFLKETEHMRAMQEDELREPTCNESTADVEEMKRRLRARALQSTVEFVTQNNNFDHMRDGEIDCDASLDAFTMRTGFQWVYARAAAKRQSRFETDHTHLYGEFAFRYTAKPAVIVRTNRPLVMPCRDTRTTHWLADGILGSHSKHIGKIVPTTHLMRRDTHELDVRAGYMADHPNIPHPFVHTMVVDIGGETGALAAIDGWNLDKEDGDSHIKADTVATVGMNNAFAACVTQAYHMGFTQYNDITYPFATQCIVTDGEQWMFCVYQLNTLNLAHDYEEQYTIDRMIKDYEPDEEFMFKPYDRKDVKETVLKSVANMCWHSDVYSMSEDGSQIARHLLAMLGSATMSDEELSAHCDGKPQPFIQPRVRTLPVYDEEALTLYDMREK